MKDTLFSRGEAVGTEKWASPRRFIVHITVLQMIIEIIGTVGITKCSYR